MMLTSVDVVVVLPSGPGNVVPPSSVDVPPSLPSPPEAPESLASDVVAEEPLHAATAKNARPKTERDVMETWKLCCDRHARNQNRRFDTQSTSLVPRRVRGRSDALERIRSHCDAGAIWPQRAVASRPGS